MSDDGLPDAYRALFGDRDKGARREVAPHAPLDPGRATAYAAKALAGEVDKLYTAPEGTRNDHLNVAAFNLSQLVAAGHLDHGRTWDLLREAGLRIGLSEAEVFKTLTSGFEAGSRQPRVVADLDDGAPPPVTILNLDEDAPDPETPDVERLFPRINWDELWADETTDEWIVYPLIPARRLVALFSPPKVGKSLLMLELAAKIAQGDWVLGAKPKPLRVLYVDFENDPRGDIRTRLQNMGFSPKDLDNLVYLSFPQLAYLDTPMGGLQLMEAVKHYGCVVVIIDTISRAVGGEENANDTWLGFYKNTGLRLKAAGVATVRLDHTGKDETKGMRGGSAKYGDVDAVWAMTRVTEETYQLECTANRLPIGEKLLVLHRKENPLRHHVDPTGVFGALEAKDGERIRVLDKAFGTEPVSIDEAEEVLRAAGIGKRRTDLINTLLPRREASHGRYGKPIEGAPAV